MNIRSINTYMDNPEQKENDSVLDHIRKPTEQEVAKRNKKTEERMQELLDELQQLYLWNYTWHDLDN